MLYLFISDFSSIKLFANPLKVKNISKRKKSKTVDQKQRISDKLIVKLKVTHCKSIKQDDVSLYFLR